MSLLAKVNGNINTTDVAQLMSIFGKLGWKIHTENDSLFCYEDLFNKFCEFLACLNGEERELVLALTEDFLHCPYTVYPKLMKEALLQIPDEIIDECKSVFLIPLIDPKDVGKTKSGSGNLYSLLYTVIPQIKKLHDKKPKSYVNPYLLADKHTTRKDSLILLFDDFVGSGDTAIGALEDYNNKIRKDSDIPIVVSLVSQLEGAINIENFGFQIYSSIIRGKCVSDSDTISNKTKAIKILRKIENQMGVSKDYRLGYKKSQALVSMMRAPNNTLPIYWWSTKPDGESWNGIFRRK